METILIFIIFLGPLVFFHELGHFFFARLAGVRVEVFSIGFGPKLFTFKKGETQYAVSLIPLGGYVKMFGDDPLSEKKLTAEEEKVAYTKKSKFARFWIVFGGPLANFILAYFIYAALLYNGESVPQIKLGNVTEAHVLYKDGLRTGDVITKINEKEIVSFDDLNLIDTNINSVEVNRSGQTVDFKVSYTQENFLEEFSKLTGVLRAPILVNNKGEFFLAKIADKKIVSLEEILEASEQRIRLYSLKEDVKMEFQANRFSIEGLNYTTLERNQNWEKTFVESGLFPKDMYIKNIVMGSAADKAKLKKGDIITAVAGNKITNFDDLRKSIQDLKEEKPVALEIYNKDGYKTVTVTPTFREHKGKKYLSVGVESGVSFYSFMVQTKSAGVFGSISKAVGRTWNGTVKTLAGFKKLITGEVSINNVGGPIMIGKVASDSFNISLSMFFRLMAIISINLGIINLFPIPVLDGGHIVLLGVEAINRGPLSKKKLMYAQQVGMSLLLLLIFIALFNDISRFF